jgi:hypothetical protein
MQLNLSSLSCWMKSGFVLMSYTFKEHMTLGY